jgi:hypothetical protein
MRSATIPLEELDRLRDIEKNFDKLLDVEKDKLQVYIDLNDKSLDVKCDLITEAMEEGMVCNQVFGLIWYNSDMSRFDKLKMYSKSEAYKHFQSQIGRAQELVEKYKLISDNSSKYFKWSVAVGMLSTMIGVVGWLF